MTGAAPLGLVLQVERAGAGAGVAVVTTQAALLRAAAVGVPVARVVAVGAGPAELGAPFLLCERVEGETLGRRLLREPTYADAGPGSLRSAGGSSARCTPSRALRCRYCPTSTS